MMRLSNFVLGSLAMALLLATATSSFAAEVTGTIRSVSADRNEIVLKGILKDTTYQMVKDPWIVLDGRKCKLNDLREGDKVTVEYQEKGGNLTGLSARALRSASEVNGNVRFVLTDKNQIVLKGVLKDTVYTLEKNATFLYNGKPGNFSDLKEKDQVIITYVQSGDNLMVSEVRVIRK